MPNIIFVQRMYEITNFRFPRFYVRVCVNTVNVIKYQFGTFSGI